MAKVESDQGSGERKNKTKGVRGGNGYEGQQQGVSSVVGSQHQGKPERNQPKTQMQYERRQNKLPPRLAKQREQNRMAQKGFASKGGAGLGGVTSAWGTLDDAPIGAQAAAGVWGAADLSSSDPSGADISAGSGSLLDHLGELHLKQGMADPRENVDLPVNTTLIFENTNLKGGRPSPPAAALGGPSQVNNIHMPIGMAVKPEKRDNGIAATPSSASAPASDLKLNFGGFEGGTFEPNMVAVAAANVATAGGTTPVDLAAATAATGSTANRGLTNLPPSSSEDLSLTQQDLDLKIASVKKVWDSRPEATPSVTTATRSPFVPSRFQSSETSIDPKASSEASSAGPTGGSAPIQVSSGSAARSTTFGGSSLLKKYLNVIPNLNFLVKIRTRKKKKKP